MLRSSLIARGTGILRAAKRRRSFRAGHDNQLGRQALEPLEDRTLLSTVQVDVINFAFSPSTVSIHVGDTIEWVWQASDHSTTSVNGSGVSWDSGVKNAGFTYDVIFNQTGTFNYYCKIHGFDNGNGTAGGMSGTIKVTTAATLSSIQVTPADPSVPAGETEQFTAIGTYSDNSTSNITSSVNWVSASTNIATISNTAGAQGLATTVAQGTSQITASLSGVSGSTTLTALAPVLQAIAVAPTSPTVPKGETEAFKATGTFSDHSTEDLTSQVEWASSATSVATISNTAGSNGVATAVSLGSSTISAALSGVSGSTTLVVSAAALKSIAIAPVDPSVPKGETQQFTATGTFSDNSTSDISSQVNWSSSATAVATISNAAGSHGLATALTTGSSTITAALGGVSSNTTMTVAAAALESIAIAPASPSVPKGDDEDFTATGTFSDNSTSDITNQVNWTSSATNVATISNAAGSQGSASTLAIGSTTITAALSGISSHTTLTVLAAALRSIAITPADPSVPKGETEQFTATGTFSDNSTSDITSQVTWSSSATAVATISNAASSHGLATTLSAGTSTISAALESFSDHTTLTVIASPLVSIAIMPANPSVPDGENEPFTATGTFADNSTADVTSQVDWTSSAPAVATISNAAGSQGSASTLSVGTTTITATLSGVSAHTALSVIAAALKSIAVTPANPSVPDGENEQFTATGTFSDNSTSDITSHVNWSSSATAVAMISNAAGSQGLAATLTTGISTITAAMNGVSATTTLTVGAPALESIAVTAANPSVPKGESDQFTATGTFSDHSTSDITATANWTSSATTVATISNAAGAQGLAAAVATGTSTIMASLDGVSASATLTVTAAVLKSIAVTPADPSVPKGENEQFTATGTFSDNSTSNITSQVNWSSSATAVATISNAAGSQGLTATLTTGTSTITAALGGVSSETTLTVVAAAIESIAITPAGFSLPKGETKGFTATGTLSDSSTEDVTNLAQWSSSDSAIASISNSSGTQGVATAVATGTTTVSAMLDGVGASTSLTVLAPALITVSVTPGDPSVPDGELQVFKATGTFSDQSTEDVTSEVTWSSAGASIATISNDGPTQGVATSVGVGSSVISASLSGVSGSTTLTVTPAVLEMFMLSPTDSSVARGDTQQFMAMGMYSDNSMVDFTNQVTWTSSSPGVATVSNATGSQGLATTLNTGTTTITASLNGVSGITTLTVTPAALKSIAIAAASPNLPDGETEPFVATGTLTDGTTVDLTHTVTWSSAAPAVATISNSTGTNGVATAQATGHTTIMATENGVSSTADLTVTPAVLVSISVSSASATIIQGATQQFTAIGNLSDKAIENLTGLVTWASSSSSVGSVSATGLATGVSAGSATLTATFNGFSASAGLFVEPALVTVMKITPVTNKRHQVTKIEVFFSGLVNTAEAGSTLTYTLKTPGKKNSFTAKNAGSIKLKSAKYSPAANEVILTPRAAFALSKPVQLTISGSRLQDSLGRFLDGNDDGQAGGNRVVVISKKAVTITS